MYGETRLDGDADKGQETADKKQDNKGMNGQMMGEGVRVA